MNTSQGNTNPGCANHPIIWFVSFVAAVIGIYTFVTGRSSLWSSFSVLTPEPWSQPPPSSSSKPPTTLQSQPTVVSQSQPEGKPVQPTVTLAPRILDFETCPTSCTGTNAQTVFSEKSKKIYARWSYENIPPGAHYVRSWSNNASGEFVSYDCKWQKYSSGVDEVSLTEPKGLRSGIWQITISVDGQVLLEKQITVQGQWEYWNPAGGFGTCYGKT